jgi:invasion protein IalB
MSSRNPFVLAGVGPLVAAAALCAATFGALAQEAPTPAPAAPAAPAAPSAQAAPAAPGAPSPWIKVCNTNPETKVELCVVNQELRSETGQPIAALTIQSTKEPGKYGVGIVVPIGFVLPPGITLAVDGAKQATAQYTICIPPNNRQPAICIAQAAVEEAFISALKKGNKLALVVVNPQNKAIPIEMSLSGFSKTFDGPGVDRAAAEAQREQLSQALQKSAEEARKKLIEQQQKDMGTTP